MYQLSSLRIPSGKKALRSHSTSFIVNEPGLTPRIHCGVCVCVATSKFSCDICINNILALHNTHMIAQYSRVDSRLLQLGYFVKHWAKCRKLDEPYTGTLSSYAWILLVRLSPRSTSQLCCYQWTRAYLGGVCRVVVCAVSSSQVINFLQQRSPPVLPCLQRVAPSGDLRGDVPVVMVKGHNCYYYSDDIRRLRFRSQNQVRPTRLLSNPLCLPLPLDSPLDVRRKRWPSCCSNFSIFMRRSLTMSTWCVPSPPPSSASSCCVG